MPQQATAGVEQPEPVVVALRTANNRALRLRSLGETPLALGAIAFRYTRVGNRECGSDDVPAHFVYSFLEHQCGDSVSRIEDRPQACARPDHAAADFGLPAGHPVLLSIRVAFDLQGASVEFRRSWLSTQTHGCLSELRWIGVNEDA